MCIVATSVITHGTCGICRLEILSKRSAWPIKYCPIMLLTLLPITKLCFCCILSNISLGMRLYFYLHIRFQIGQIKRYIDTILKCVKISWFNWANYKYFFSFKRLQFQSTYITHANSLCLAGTLSTLVFLMNFGLPASQTKQVLARKGKHLYS